MPLSKQLNAASSRLYQQNASVINRYGRWVLVAWLAALADGKLLLAIASSTLLYHSLAAGYQFPQEKLEAVSRRLGAHLSRLGQTPLLASTLAFATTYGFAAAWSQLGGGWAAMTLLGLAAGNLLFFWRDTSPPNTDLPTGKTIAPPAPTTADRFGPTWDELSSPDPLKRLRAVRSLLRWCLSSTVGTEVYLPGMDITVRSHLVDCLRVMLVQETEPIVRSALVEGLKALQPKAQLPSGQPAIASLQARPQTVQTPIVSRPVEYIEP